MTKELQRCHADEDGISLVEMLVALLVVGIVLTAMASTAIASLHSVQSTERITRATALGNEVLENLHAIPYDDAGLYTTPAANEFSGATFEGDDLVLLPDASPPDPDVPAPLATVDRDGIDYSVRTAIVWVDDDADGLGAADPDGEQDYKRFIVDISWSLRGETSTRRVEGLRSPAPGEQLVTVTIEPDVVALDAGGNNAESFTIGVFAQESQSSVKVSYLDRSGGTAGPTAMVAGNSEKTVWSYEFLTGTGSFANGETLFRIEATSAVGSTVTNTIGRALFLHTLTVESITTTPAALTVTVDEDTSAVLDYCEDELEIDADVDGAIASDAVEATVDGIGPRAMSVTGNDVEGTQFELLMETSTLVLIPGTAATVEVDAERTVGTVATATATLEVPVQAVDECA